MAIGIQDSGVAIMSLPVEVIGYIIDKEKSLVFFEVAEVDSVEALRAMLGDMQPVRFNSEGAWN